MPYTISGILASASINAVGGTSIQLSDYTPDAARKQILLVNYFNANNGNVARSMTIADTLGANDSWTQLGSNHYDTGASVGWSAFQINTPAATSSRIVATFNAAVEYPSALIFDALDLEASGFELFINAVNAGSAVTDTTVGPSSALTEQPCLVVAASLELPGTNGAPALATGYTNIGAGTDWNYGGATGNSVRLCHKRVTSLAAVSAAFHPAADNTGNHSNILLVLQELGASAGAAAGAALRRRSNYPALRNR